MRNETMTLTSEQAAKVVEMEGTLSTMEGQTISVDFVKRDGTPRTLVGTMVDLYGGSADKRVVRLDTEQGPRSANLYAVLSVSTV